MEIRQAILKAADHIEANPNLYRFYSGDVPGCGTPGCMVGWTGHFLGASPGRLCWLDGSVGIIGVHSDTFSSRIIDLITPGDLENNRDAAKALRLYADKYHPAESEQYPDVSRELDRIFNREIA